MKITRDWTIKKDPHCWILYEEYDGQDKKGNPKRNTKQTYHSNFSQLASHILDSCAGDCENLDELEKLFKTATEALAKQIEVKVVTT